MTSIRRLLARVVRIEPGEGPVLAWSFAYFFFLLASYYVIRPIRDALGISGTEDRLTWLYTGTLLGTLVANPILGALVSRFPRRVFLPIVYHILTANLLVFYFLLAGLSGDRQLYAGRVFFVWVSVYNLFAVSVFWGFMADVWRSEQGKRLFGFIGLGGTLGGIAGASVTAGLSRAIGPIQLLLVSAVLLQAAVACIRILARVTRAAQRSALAAREAEAPPGHGVWSGIRLVARSPYLLGACGFLLLYSVTSTLIYFEQARLTRAAIADPAARAEFFARIDLVVNLVTAFTQALLTGRILARFGVGGALASLPAITLVGFAALAAFPGRAVLVVFQVVRRIADLAIARPAREVLFTVVSREEKYTAKNLIDTFVYRGGDLAGAWLDRGLGLLALGAGGIAAAFVPIAAAWVALSVALGRRQRTLERSAAGAPIPSGALAGKGT